MNRIYHHYTKWEDLQNGMYIPVVCDETNKKVIECKELLANHVRFYEVMKRLVVDWKYSVEFNLSNSSYNRRAWLGRSACCFELQATESHVRVAWFMLTKKEMDLANMVADRIILKFENNNDCKNLYLFEVDYA